MRFTGELPLGQSFWSRETKLPDWRNARGRLTIDKAQMSALSPLYPELLNPQGDLSVELNVEPGPKLAGSVNISGARTRPIPTLGPIRDIEVKLILKESNLRTRDRQRQHRWRWSNPYRARRTCKM